MALTIDSAVVLRAMADHPDAFPALKADLDETARKLLVKQLKAKMTDASLLHRLFAVTSRDTMLTILDGFSANDLVGLVKKIDPHGPFAKAGCDLHAARVHVAGIGEGRLQPSTEPEKPVKAPRKAPKAAAAPETSKIGVILDSKVHSGKPRVSRAKKY